MNRTLASHPSRRNSGLRAPAAAARTGLTGSGPVPPNPGWARAQSDSDAWTQHMGLGQPRLGAPEPGPSPSRSPPLWAYLHPDAPGPVLRLLRDWSVWLVEARGRHQAASEASVDRIDSDPIDLDRLQRLMSGAPAASTLVPSGPLEHALLDLWTRSTDGIGDDIRRRFAQLVERALSEAGRCKPAPARPGPAPEPRWMLEHPASVELLLTMPMQQMGSTLSPALCSSPAMRALFAGLARWHAQLERSPRRVRPAEIERALRTTLPVAFERHGQREQLPAFARTLEGWIDGVLTWWQRSGPRIDPPQAALGRSLAFAPTGRWTAAARIGRPCSDRTGGLAPRARHDRWSSSSSGSLLDRAVAIARAKRYLLDHCHLTRRFQSLVGKTAVEEPTEPIPIEIFTTCIIVDLVDDLHVDPALIEHLVTYLDGWHDQGRFHFFEDRHLLPPDVDCIAYGLLPLLRRDLVDRATARELGQQLLANTDARGVLQTYLDPSGQRGHVDPCVCANGLSLLFALDLAAGVDPTIEYLYTTLTSPEHRGSTRYYPSPDAFLYFLSRLYAQHPTRMQRFEAPLVAALRKRLDHGASALELAMRVVSCDRMGVDACSTLEQLAARQLDDGAWPAGSLYRAGRHEAYFGCRALTTAFALRALIGGPSRRAASAIRRPLRAGLEDGRLLVEHEARPSPILAYPFRSLALTPSVERRAREHLRRTLHAIDFYRDRGQHAVDLSMSYVKFCCPRGSNWALVADNATLIAYVFYLDGLSRLDANFRDTYAFYRSFRAADGEPTRPIPGPAERQYVEFIRGLRRAAGPTRTVEGFLASISSMLDAFEDRAERLEHGRGISTREYMNRRLYSIAVPPHQELTKIHQGAGEAEAATLEPFEIAASELVYLANDIHSERRDLDANTSNLIILVQQERGLSREQSRRTVIELHDAVLRRFIERTAQAMRGGLEHDRGAVRYLEFLETAVQGSLQAILESSADYLDYVPPVGPTLHERRTVFTDEARAEALGASERAHRPVEGAPRPPAPAVP